MRLVHAAVLLAVSASPALAQRGPYIVIPGRPDVPIFENGVDVSWSVVEGEYGLDRPNIVNPTIIYRTPPCLIRVAPRWGHLISHGMGWRPAMAVSSHTAAKPPLAAAGPKLQPFLADGVSAHARGPSVE